MSQSVQMPALGESVTEGTVTRWLKQVGDQVEVDEPLLEVSTDKVDTEIPSPVAGVLTEILVEEDETVEVGADLCRVGDAAETQAPAAEPAPTAAAPEPEPEPEPVRQPESQPAAPKGGAASGGGAGTPVQMPALGESVTEGTVTRWLKQVGDQVEVDEPLLEVSTDKVDTEIPSPVAGVLTKVLVNEDETVEVGADLCLVGDAAAAAAAPEPEPEPAAQEAEPEPAPQEAEPEPEPAGRQEPQQQDAPKDAVPAGDAGRAGYVTPLVRKLAAQNGIDLGSLTGTGVGGRIRKEDVEEAARAKQAPAPEPTAAPAAPAASAAAPAASGPAERPGPSPIRGTTEKMSRLRKIIAERMVESLQVSAQLTTLVEVDMTRIAALRNRAKAGFKAREGAGLSFLPFVAVAAIDALRVHPKLNATIEGDEIRYPDGEHLGIAVDTEKGLLVPVIRDAGDLNLAGLARKVADLAERTRTNRITPDELSGGTFTLTNTGSRGALFDTPIINQPQVAILGFGAVVKRPVVVPDADGNDSISIRSMMYLALSYDHRLVDGADAARFLSTMKQRLEEGSFEHDLGL